MQPNGRFSSSVKLNSETLPGWGLTGLLCAIPVVFWLNLHNISKIETFGDIVFALGQLAGIVGLVLYSINLVLTTRLKFLESLFGGLNRVYIAHHIIGGLALLLLVFHPLLLALRYVGASAYEAFLLLLPNGLGPITALFDDSAAEHAAVLYQWAVFFGIIAFWGLVVLLTITFFVKLPYRIWLFIHKFLGLAFFFAGLHILFVGSDMARSPALKVYLLTMVALGLAAFTYKTLVGNIVLRKYKYKVSDVKTVGDNVTEILLKPMNQLLQHQPGQFVFVRFLANKKVGREWHPFSISSSPEEDLLRLDIKSLGDYTTGLSRLQPGDIAEIEGAYGRFSYTRFSNPNQVWIAGGIGITPFLSMARSLDTKNYNIGLFYCVNSPSELIDWQLLNNASKTNPNFNLYTFVKSKNNSYLTASQIAKTVGGLDDKEIFICGPPAMMKSLRAQLRTMKIPSDKIHTEEFSMS